VVDICHQDTICRIRRTAVIGPNSLYALEAFARSRRQELLAEAADERLLRAARGASLRRTAARPARLRSSAIAAPWLSLDCCPLAA
jgi:hypothetical protein